jgi:molybdopterin molybdotransferase
VLLTKGTRLSARSLMLAAAMNHATVPVRRRPHVALLATGDELVPPGHDLGSDEIVSSVRYGLAAMIAACGGVPLDLGIAKDDAKSIATLASSGAGADILVTVGGASVGDRDLVVSTLEAQGLKLDFAKVAMRPGQPAFYGHMGTQRVFGVPGNPVSAMICAQVFLLPMLRAMLAARDPIATPSEAVADVDLEANGPRQHYMRAIARRRDDGVYVVRPLISQDSSLMAALVRADCLIVRMPYAPVLPAGGRVHILPFAG